MFYSSFIPFSSAFLPELVDFVAVVSAGNDQDEKLNPFTFVDLVAGFAHRFTLKTSYM